MGNDISSYAQKRQQAIECLANNQLKKAKLLILDIIENEEEKHKAFIKLGDISTQLNEYKEAEKYYQTSISECPEDPNSYLKYGNLLHEQLNDAVKAQEMYETCIKLSCMEVNDECWFNFGKLMFKLNQFDKAIACYAKCETERACIHYHSAKCLLKTNNTKSAAFALEKATEIKPTVAKYHYEYAKCLTDLKSFERANNSFEKAAQLSQFEDINILNDFIHFLLYDINDNEKASKYIQIIKDLDKEEKQEEKEENIDDFILRDYIRGNLDKFMKKMTFLGVNILKTMHVNGTDGKQQIDDYDSIELAKKIKDGHTMETFVCPLCSVSQQFGGIELRNCLHKICYPCFKWKIYKAVNYKKVPFCNTCRSTISCKDIAVHFGENTANNIQTMKSKIKYERNYSNKLVQYPTHKENIGNYHMSMDQFQGNWENITDIHNSNMIEAFKVKYESEEWNKVMLHVRTAKHLHIQKIERIQNANLWRAFSNYCIEQKVKNCKDIMVGGFWHGSGPCKPSVIWQGNGFDKTKARARIEKCNWFATDNLYSMNGWQHTTFDIDKKGLTNQVFLAFVATGNPSDCKFIRHNQILNVYKNEASYPAYLITYSKSYDDIDW